MCSAPTARNNTGVSGSKASNHHTLPDKSLPNQTQRLKSGPTQLGRATISVLKQMIGAEVAAAETHDAVADERYLHD